jgi:hypothetical protein
MVATEGEISLSPSVQADILALKRLSAANEEGLAGPPDPEICSPAASSIYPGRRLIPIFASILAYFTRPSPIQLLISVPFFS